jgi:hypothetical protein
MTKQNAERAPEERKPDRVAWELDELTKAGHGSRTYLYQEIGAGRLRALKRGRRTIVLEAERKGSLPAAEITYRSRTPSPDAA